MKMSDWICIRWPLRALFAPAECQQRDMSTRWIILCSDAVTCCWSIRRRITWVLIRGEHLHSSLWCVIDWRSPGDRLGHAPKWISGRVLLTTSQSIWLRAKIFYWILIWNYIGSFWEFNWTQVPFSSLLLSAPPANEPADMPTESIKRGPKVVNVLRGTITYNSWLIASEPNQQSLRISHDDQLLK